MFNTIKWKLLNLLIHITGLEILILNQITNYILLYEEQDLEFTTIEEIEVYPEYETILFKKTRE